DRPVGWEIFAPARFFVSKAVRAASFLGKSYHLILLFSQQYKRAEFLNRCPDPDFACMLRA
ncbi:MAG: hypothetical protein ACPGRZ_19225, partial [Alphaproteobacteria bacterium]